EAVSGVMDPVAESCGRDAQVSVRVGAHKKNLTCHPPLALRAGGTPSTLRWHPAPRTSAACVRSPRRARPASGDRGHIPTAGGARTALLAAPLAVCISPLPAAQVLG